MVTRERLFRSPAGRGVVIGTSIVLAPVVAVGIAGAASRDFDALSVVVLILIGGGALWASLLASRTAAFVACASDRVMVGLAPFWKTTLSRRNIARVDLVHVDAYTDYGGWGIKGSARSSRGRLYSVGGEATVKITMKDRRVFLVSFFCASEAEQAAEALKSIGCDQG